MSTRNRGIHFEDGGMVRGFSQGGDLRREEIATKRHKIHKDVFVSFCGYCLFVVSFLTSGIRVHQPKSLVRGITPNSRDIIASNMHKVAVVDDKADNRL